MLMLTKKRKLIPIFEYPMTIIIFDEWEDLENSIPNEIYREPSRGITIEYDKSCIVCCTPKYQSSIVHEAGHIKNLVWKYIGYFPQRDNDEVDQYLQTYIYNEIKKVLNKHLVK